MKATKTIAGHNITLEVGERYLASRPIDDCQRKTFPVHIRPLDNKDLPEVTIPDLTYDEANSLINAFNNGESSFIGRVW